MKRKLTPAGRKWLKAQLAIKPSVSWASIGGELAKEIKERPKRKRGRPVTMGAQRPEDEWLLEEYNARIYECFLGGRPSRFKKTLRDMAREVDAQEDWCGDPDTRYKRLRRILDKEAKSALGRLSDEELQELLQGDGH
jgi:hypothetical protein